MILYGVEKLRRIGEEFSVVVVDVMQRGYGELEDDIVHLVDFQVVVPNSYDETEINSAISFAINQLQLQTHGDLFEKELEEVVIKDRIMGLTPAQLVETLPLPESVAEKLNERLTAVLDEFHREEVRKAEEA